MSSGCGDVLSLADLQTAEKHQIFEAEVITGKQGGVAGGADIDYATNQVTGQTQKTLPAVLRDAGFRAASFTFDTGGTLGVNDADLAVMWSGPSGNGMYYSWHGSLPKTIPAGSSPATPGGESDTAWKLVGDLGLRADLAQPSGASLVGYSDGTIEDALDSNADFKVNYIGTTSATIPPAIGFSTNTHYNPVAVDGEIFTSKEFQKPVVIDASSMSDPVVPESGVIFKFGKPGLTSGAFFSQDNYQVRNLSVNGGSPEVISFEPYTGLTAHIDNVRITNNGDPNKYAINFKGQNWWPTVSNNMFKDYTDKKGNFCKAIDDGGDPSIRRSANSRLLFTGNKVYFGGAALGGSMLTASAVFNIIRDNACEHAERAVILEYPSSYTVIDGLYAECFYGGGTVITLGDLQPDASIPSMRIAGVSINNAYFNNHSQSSNKFIGVGNPTVSVSELAVNNVTITNSHIDVPVITLNDLAGQSVQVGNIRSGGRNLLGLSNNTVQVTSTAGQFVDSYNSGISVAGVPDSVSVSGSRAPAFGNYFLNSTGSSTVTRAPTGASIGLYRNAEYSASFNADVSAFTSLEWQNPKYSAVSGGIACTQLIARASAPVTATVLVSVKKPGSTVSLATYGINLTTSPKEFTIPFTAVVEANSEAVLSVTLAVEGLAAPVTVECSAFRVYRGDTGLCAAANMFGSKELQTLLPMFTFY